MNTLTQRSIKKLSVVSIITLAIFHSSYLTAEKAGNPILQRYSVTQTKKNRLPNWHRNNESYYSLPESAFICDGRVVMAPKVIKRQLSCIKSSKQPSFFVKL